jgi:O-antigen/teichoic acid export membrane protein
VLSGLAVYLTSYADRWLVRYWLGLDGLGLYGVAFKIASIAGVAISAVQMAVTPLVYQSYTDPRTPQLLRSLLCYLLAAVLPAVGLVAALAPELVSLLAGVRFQGAAPAAGWLSLGVVLMGLYVFAPGMGLAKRTKRIALTNVGVAACNVALGLILVPALGIIGAAVAYAMGGVAMVSLYLWGSHRFYLIRYPFRAYGGVLLVTLALLATFSILDLQRMWRLALWLVAALVVMATLFRATRSAPSPEMHAGAGARMQGS